MRAFQSPAWINPQAITFLEPRYYRGYDKQAVIVGTRVYFGQQDMLDVTDTPQTVVARLEGRLPEPWHHLEDQNGIDAAYENALEHEVDQARATCETAATDVPDYLCGVVEPRRDRICAAEAGHSDGHSWVLRTTRED
jgi:hypothetical protein